MCGSGPAAVRLASPQMRAAVSVDAAQEGFHPASARKDPLRAAGSESRPGPFRTQVEERRRCLQAPARTRGSSGGGCQAAVALLRRASTASGVVRGLVADAMSVLCHHGIFATSIVILSVQCKARASGCLGDPDARGSSLCGPAVRSATGYGVPGGSDHAQPLASEDCSPPAAPLHAPRLSAIRLADGQ
jgi:hypothetical protein